MPYRTMTPYRLPAIMLALLSRHLAELEPRSEADRVSSE